MTRRIPLDGLKADALDALYDRAEHAEAGQAAARHAVTVLAAAIDELPVHCRFHGDRLDPPRRSRQTEACCDSGRPARHRRAAVEALAVLVQGSTPLVRTGPSVATVDRRRAAAPVPDPRQPAWDEVYAYIRRLPVRDADLNALIWRAVDAALIGLGYPSSYVEVARAADTPGQADTPLADEPGRPRTTADACPACDRTSLYLGDGGYLTCATAGCPRPDAAADTFRTPGHPKGGHVRELPPAGEDGLLAEALTCADTVRTRPGHPCPDTSAGHPDTTPDPVPPDTRRMEIAAAISTAFGLPVARVAADTQPAPSPNPTS
ncbi:hypothetical protein [Kitasatospora sp. NPDC058046]|uniref:hypothetical protein n=1 Tax=Kitasatospora sp. NPDC058046 TaxID=3346312 RepID=UPI0036DE5355